MKWILELPSTVLGLFTPIKKVVFLDRDGVINVKPPEHVHVTYKDDFVLLPDVRKAIKICKRYGYKVVIITNQREVPMWQVVMINNYMLKLIPEIDLVCSCNHAVSANCECRKPKPGLFYKAERYFKVYKRKSFMIGDSVTDIQAAKAYGIKGYLTTDLYTTVKEIFKL